jgi:NitT/TauT family transport system substrate-binding protein
MKHKRSKLAALLIAFFMTANMTKAALAEVSEVTIARQYGIIYLPLMLMEHDKLFEKYAKKEGLEGASAKFIQLGGTAIMNDALLSGTLDFASVGAPALAKLWDKTKGTQYEVKGVAAISSMPMLLNTRDPTVHSIRDFTEKNKIAMNAVKVSIYAIVLQMAAAKEFGDKNYDKLDAFTVSLPHPEATRALLSGVGGIDSHFTAPPYSSQELAQPGIHTVLSSGEVVGRHGSIVLLVSTSRFREQNPKAYKAMFAAYSEAIDLLNRDKENAAKIYLQMTKSKESMEAVLNMLNDKETEFTVTPNGTMNYVDFMYKIGLIKNLPVSWKDLFFPEVHQLPGN